MSESKIENDNIDAHEQNTLIGDIISGFCFTLFAVLMFIGAINFSWQTIMGFMTAASFTPILLSILIIILSSILILQTIVKHRQKTLQFKHWVHMVAKNERNKRFLVLMLITGVYIILVGKINFILLNFIFIFAMYAYLKVDNLLKIFIYSCINAAIIGYIIPKIFQMPLP